MEIRPIIASLNKHRIPALLIVLEIALACTVLCNAVFMIGQRVASMSLANGIDEQDVSVLKLRGTDPAQAASDVPRNLNALRSIPGVKAVAAMSSVPLSQNNWGWSFSTEPGVAVTNQNNTNISLYFVGAGADKALGLRLLQGRFFNATEFANSSIGDSALADTHVMVVTRSLAQKLWPDQPALGKGLYTKGHSYTVIGVVADVLRPWIGSGEGRRSYFSAYFPLRPSEVMGTYVVRSAPGDREQVLRQAVQALNRLNPNAVASGRTYAAVRSSFFADMSSMTWVLVCVCAVMLAVTAFGIVGLTSFWVGQRRRQIGIRRAVGATRSDILAYFRTENFLLTGAGVLIGMVVAFALNAYLMRSYEMDRMPWYYLPCGAIGLWLVGQLAVLGPALRASRVPPVVATRST